MMTKALKGAALVPFAVLAVFACGPSVKTDSAVRSGTQQQALSCTQKLDCKPGFGTVECTAEGPGASCGWVKDSSGKVIGVTCTDDGGTVSPTCPQDGGS